MSNVSVNEMAKAINNILSQFEDATDEAVENALKKASDKAVSELREANPKDSGDWSKYNKGWKATKKTKNRKMPTTYVHNATRYQIAHLLEKGHAVTTKDGGRTEDGARAFEHIAPVATEVEQLFFDEVKKGIK